MDKAEKNTNPKRVNEISIVRQNDWHGHVGWNACFCAVLFRDPVP